MVAWKRLRSLEGWSAGLQERVAQTCAAFTIAIALLALAGWVTGKLILASLHADFIPMSPTTALAFVLLGGALLAGWQHPANQWVRWLASAATGLVLVMGLLILAQHLTGTDLGLERWLSGSSATLGEVPIGRMSAPAAGTFVVAGLVLLVLLASPTGWRLVREMAASAAAGVTVVGLVMLLFYWHGDVFLHGGGIIPVALPTALAFVFLGIGLLVGAGPRVRTLRDYRPVFVGFGVGLAASIVLFTVMNWQEQVRVQAEFEQRADVLALTLRSALQEDIEDLENFRALFAVSRHVDRDAFRTFASQVLARHPSIRAFSWNPRIEDRERAATEMAARRDGFPAYRLTERYPDGRVGPARRRLEYAPVLYVEPLAGNEGELGFDAAFDPVRRAALERARDTGQATASERITLAQETEGGAGLFIVQPVYQPGAPATSVKERRANILGFVVEVLRLGQLIRTSLSVSDRKGLEFRFFEEAETLHDNVIFASAGAAAAERTGLRSATRITLGDRQWRLEVYPAPWYLAAKNGGQSWLLLGGGLLLTIILGAYLIASARHTTEIVGTKDALAERTRQLEVVRAISMETTRELELGTLLELITQRAVDLLGTGDGTIRLWDETEQALIPKAWTGIEPGRGDRRLRLGQGVAGTAAQRRQGMIVNNFRVSPYAVPQLLQGTTHSAVLAEPLVFGDSLVGVISVSREANQQPFTEEDRQLLGLFAIQAAIAIENARLFDVAQRELTERKQTEAALAARTRQLEAMRTVSAEITRELDLTALLKLLTQRAIELVGASLGMTRLWDEARQELLPCASQGVEEWMSQRPLRLGEGVAGTAAQRRQGLIVNDFRNSPYATPVHLARTTYTAILAEPLLYRDRLVGVLALARQAGSQPFTTDQQDLLRLFATQAAIAVENALLFQQEQKRSEQLDTVRAASAEITRELDLPSLLRLINQRSVELLGSESGAVVLWDDGAQMLVPAVWRGHGDWFGDLRWRLGEGMVGGVAQRGEGLVVNEYRSSPHAHPLFLLRTEITATLAEPLLYHDRLLGVVSVDGYGEGRTFTDHDKQLLSLLASQAAIAIENARLYAASGKRAAELDTLRGIEQAITSRLELPAVLEAVVAGAMRLLDNPYAQIILWDEANQALQFGAAKGSEAERVKNQQFKLGRGINGMVAQTREAMILDDYQASPYAEPISPDVVATITVPILFGDRLLGVLHSHTTAAGRRFSPDDLRHLQMLATQAAFAIENARLHEATERELADRIRVQEDLEQSEAHARRLAQENATMAEIGRIISSTLNIQGVYQSFANQVHKLIAFDRIVINSINVEKNVVRNLYIAGEDLADRNAASLYPLEGSGNAEMVRTQATLLLQPEDFREYQDRFPALMSTFQAGFRSIMNVPLLARGQIVGGLLLRSRTPNAYTQDDVRLAERIGAQIAGSIANIQLYLENAQLYEASVQRGAELETLREIEQAMASHLDLPAVLEAVVAGAMRLLDNPFAQIILWDAASQSLCFGAAQGPDTERVKNQTFELGRGINGVVAQTREPMMIDDYQASPYAVPECVDVVATISVPILFGDRLLGVLHSHTTTAGRRFTPDDLRRLQALATQAAYAIENARLHETAVQRAQQLSSLTRLTQSLVASMSAEAVGKEVMAAVQALMPQAAARLWDIQGDDLESLEVLASTGLQDTRGGTVRFRLGEGLAGVAVSSRRPVFSLDLSQDPRFVNKGWAAQEGLVSGILFPLLIGEKVHGILAIFTREPHDFSQTEVALFQSLASHAAIALENAWLHISAARRGMELEALLQSGKEIGSSLDLDQVLQAVVQRAALISAAPIVRLFLLDEDAQLLRCRVAVGFPLEEARELVIPVGVSLSGRVAATGEPLAVPDTGNDPRTHFPAHVAKYGLVSYLGLPVKFQDRLLGVLVFNTPAPRTYSTDEIAFLTGFAQVAALTIQNAHLHETAVQRAQQLGTLNDVARALTQTLDPELAIREVMKAIQLLIPGAAGQLWETREDPAGLQLVTTVGVRQPGLAFRHRILFGEGLGGIAAASREAVLSADVTQDPRFVNREWAVSEGLTSGVGLPLIHAEEILGALVIFTRARHSFADQELDLLESFAAHAAIAIDNAHLHDTVQRHAAELEARVTERTAALEEALRVKAEFLAKMSHELRTPLNFVLGFADLLKRGTGGTLTPKQGGFVDRIASGGKHLLDLVSDLLDLSLVEAGRKGLQLQGVPLAPLVREVLDLFDIQATQKRLALRQTVEPGLTLVAERHKLIQILTNLVANSVKFTPEGGTITVTARIADCRLPSADSQTGDAGQPSQIANRKSQVFEIAVADTGIGLAPQDVERIFQGFEQVDGSSTRRYGGAGIGLALVRTLVELHGGQVWAESEGVGHGARFVIQLPPLEAPRPKRVLVVEDHIPLLKTLCVFLRDAGFAVEGVTTGAEALTAVRDRRPDLVVLDIGLPDIDGWEVLRRLRADAQTGDLRVLVLTGLGEGDAERALTLGANEFLTKPVSPSTLVGVAMELMAGAPRPPGPLPPASGA